MKRSWLEVNFKNLLFNLKLIEKLAGKKEIMCVIKCNAYGCGAIAIAKFLEEKGVKYFGVACLDEALELREYGIKGEILVFGPTQVEWYSVAFSSKINLTITDEKELIYIIENKIKNPLIHVKVDTGMGRIGFKKNEVKAILKKISEYPDIEIQGIYSHLSCADIPREDEYTLTQLNEFKEFEKLEKIKYKHILNSAGVIRFADMTATNLVRVGIALYGYTNLIQELKPAVKLKTIINFIKTLDKNSYISYEKEGVAISGTTVATVSIGYGDGYSRRFSNVGYMLIDNIRCRVIGKVCMDMTIIEIPDELKNKIYVGMEIEVIGMDVLNQLKAANISPYEELVSITNRVKREYIDQ